MLYGDIWKSFTSMKMENKETPNNLGFKVSNKKMYLNDNEPFFDLAMSSGGTVPVSWFRSKFLQRRNMIIKFVCFYNQELSSVLILKEWSPCNLQDR